MWRLLEVLLSNPAGSLKFLYSFSTQSVLICLKFCFLPYLPHYQSFRQQLQRAYMSSASLHHFPIIHRLPVIRCPEERARPIGTDWKAYVIPGTKTFKSVAESPRTCVAIYAHGGGYARGEARMYLNYMERWQNKFLQQGLELVFVSVEYPLTDVASHPAQLHAFLDTYKHVLGQGVPPSQIIFMGDSAGAGCCVLASLKLEILDLPQPAAGILMSPWFDMASNSFQGGNALVETDYVTTANTGVPLFAKWWLGDHDPRSPDVNPLYCSVEQFKKLPPQLILVGGGDFVLPECRDLSRMFAKAGLRHEMVVERGEFHLYALGSNWTKRETRDRTDKYILGWMKNALQV